ncbi:MAG: sodium transporter, partial [Planctomycetes bacterium]|nr:sodium transporter [Planctomycetota bacterium]
MLLAQAHRQLSGPDYWVLVSYFVIMLGIGIYFYRFMRGMKDYFTGGNSIPWWLSGVSYWMSSFSAFAFVFYSALSYKYGIFGVTVYWVTVPAALFSLLFFANRWRRARIDSPVEFVETRYGSGLRQLFAWQGIPVKIIDDGLKIVAIGKFISVGLGMDMTQAMVWSSLIMLAYTFMGGLWAVAVTDFVQFVVMMAAVVILFPLAFSEAGGLVHFFQNAPAESLRLTNEKFSGYYIIGLVVMYCLSFSINWSLIQRYYCVPTEKDARKVGWLVVFLNIIGPPLMFLPAMAARSFLGDLSDEAQVYPLMCAKLLPAGMFGLVIAAMFSATMSMLSGDYNVVASVLTNDVYRRLLRPSAAGRELVLVGRIMTLVVGLLSLGIVFVLLGGKGEKQFQNMVTLFS